MPVDESLVTSSDVVEYAPGGPTGDVKRLRLLLGVRLLRQRGAMSKRTALLSTV